MLFLQQPSETLLNAVMANGTHVAFADLIDGMPPTVAPLSPAEYGLIFNGIDPHTDEVTAKVEQAIAIPPPSISASFNALQAQTPPIAAPDIPVVNPLPAPQPKSNWS